MQIKNKYFPIPLITNFLLILGFMNHLFCSCENDLKHERKLLTINLISSLNGKGLEADQNVLTGAIQRLGYSVNKVNFDDRHKVKADINIFFQHLIPEKFTWAKLNWFIPNPEWYTQEIDLLNEIDLILCRTREVEKIFQNLNVPTYDLGFTSIDCYQPEIKKNYNHFLHVAGTSLYKGTIPIQNIWKQNPLFPLLTVVQYPTHFVSKQPNLRWISQRVPTDQLRLLQNGCGIHLCPSETEGFGHYIMEAMSSAAVVITTDAPPMNEFIQNPSCLIPYSRSASFI